VGWQLIIWNGNIFFLVVSREIKAMKEMTSMERWDAAANHEMPDYVPIALFGGIFEVHFVPGMDVVRFGRNGVNMGKAHIAYQEAVGTDSGYCLSDMGLIVSGWGVRMKLPEVPNIWMALGKFPVQEPGDWEKLDVLDPKIDGRMHLYLDACETWTKKYGDKIPIGVSLPSPFTTTTHVCSMENTLVHMMTEPDALRKGLKVIEQTVADFINECIKSGAHYAGYLVTRASREITTEEQYREFGAPSDEYVFRHTPDIQHFCHICGVEPMFNLVDEWSKKYKNVKGISWWDAGAKPNLKEAKEGWGKQLCLMTGIDHTNTFVNGSTADVEAEIKRSCEIGMKGSGLILNPGCEIAPHTPLANMKAAVKAARKYGKY
jgi:MtaA/CmuA family methyltransferase